ncbi:MAG: hypothetical protein K0R73_1159 [Candidatus Midichloriaceae bacterium]|jgi:hypothetical protein|nr:hypothetical protein [Candidatus Midichloriaceae bacterium]
MLEQVFRYFHNELKDPIFMGLDYEALDQQGKLNLVRKLIFALRNGILNSEKPLFQTLIYKIAINNDTKASKFLAQHLFDIPIDSALLNSLAQNNPRIAEELIEKSTSLSDLEIINIVENNSSSISLIRSIAKRKHISEMLCDYVLSKKDIPSIKLMLVNHNASLSINIFVELLQTCGDDASIYNIISTRIFKIPRKLNQIFVKANRHWQNRILDTWLSMNPERIVYYATEKGLFSFGFKINEAFIRKLSSKVDALYFKHTLTELMIMKWLVCGDVHSFIYAISKNSEVSYEAVKRLVTTEFTSPYFEETLLKAGVSHEMIAASQDVLRIIYESCLEEVVDSVNFLKLLKKRFSSKNKHFEVSKNISFIISLC